jgi:serine/threonine protein kinase
VAQASRSTFGKYVLLRKLASGGMGEIFLAKQRGPSGFEKLLVIKRILAHHLDKKDYLDMFFSEAKLVARLNHHNIIQIHEMGEIDGDYYIAMEYVRGKSMRDIIDELRAEGRFLPLPHVIDLAIKLCEGLGFAHQARDIRGRPMNIVHRDINPHNILISYTGDLKLIDFGIAKSEMTSVHTATGTIKGKFVYMSPEQSAADPIDRRSDIFSVGIVVYEMCCLENPFVRQNVVLSLEAIQRHDVAPPSTKRPDAGPLDEILAKALAKKPEDRYQTATEMRDDLRNLFRDGTAQPAEEDLTSFLHKLFTGDIAEEDRLLAEADQATTPPEPAEMGAAEPSPDLIDAGSTEAPAQHPAFADEEPTLAGDLEDIQQRSENRSNLFDHSGAAVIDPDGDSGDLPHHNTRSDRVPKQSEAELVDDFPEEGATEVPPERETNPEIPSGLLQQPDNLPPQPRTPAPDPILTRTPLPSSIVPDGRRTPMPQAAFDEPMPRALVPASTLDPTREIKKNERLAPEPRPEPLPGYHITDEEQSSFTPPKPEWKRWARLLVYPAILVVTMLAGYQATRWVIGPPPEKKAVALVPLEDEPTVDPEVPMGGTDAGASAVPPPPPPPVVEEEFEDEEPGEDAVEEPDPKKDPAKPNKKKKGKKAKAPKGEVRPTKAEPKPEPEPPPPVKRKPEPEPEPPPPPPVQVAEPKPEPKPEPEEPAKKSRLGTLTLRTSSQVAVEVDGRAAGSSPASIAVKKTEGTIVLIGGAETGDSKVTLRYSVVGDGVKVEVDAEPWAIVQSNGLSVGKSPQTVAPAARHKIGLMRPGQSGPLTVGLTWSPTP